MFPGPKPTPTKRNGRDKKSDYLYALPREVRPDKNRKALSTESKPRYDDEGEITKIRQTHSS